MKLYAKIDERSPWIYLDTYEIFNEHNITDRLRKFMEGRGVDFCLWKINGDANITKKVELKSGLGALFG